MSQRRTRPGIFGPLLLIFLGVIFLFNNLNIIQWSVWDVILRFWPVLLIGAGLDLILDQRSAWGSAIALILVLAIIGGGIALLGEPNGTNAEVEQVVISGGGADRVSLLLDPAIGYVQLSSGPRGQTDLLQGKLASARGEQIEQQQAGAGKRLEIAIRTRGWTVMPFLITSFDRPAWDLELRPDTELELDLDLGIGKAEVDLRQLRPIDVQVHTGIGEAQVMLPDHGGQVRVEVGIGQLTIELPSTAGVRIQVDSGIGTTVIPTEFTMRDGSYFSPGYDQAEQKIDLILDIGIGTVIVR
jgi:hypothetical protein